MIRYPKICLIMKMKLVQVDSANDNQVNGTFGIPI